MADDVRPPSDGGEAELRKGALTFLEQQIDKLRETAPAWVRAIVYFMFCAAFVIIVLRITVGDYIVSGHIDVQAPNGTLSAVGYEVKANDLYAVNSKGDFHAVMSLRDFVPMFLTGNATLKVYKNSLSSSYKMTYGRWAGKFDDLEIKIEGTSVGTPQVPPSESELRLPLLDLVPSAYAMQPAAARLIVDSIRMGKLNDRADAEVYVRLGDDRYDLRYVSDVTTVSLRKRETRQLGRDYFCPIPMVQSGYVSVHAHTGIFSRVHERFRFSSLPAYNRPTPLPGDDGGEMWVRLVTNYDFVLFRRPDIAPLVPSIQSQLEAAGFRVVVSDAPAGDTLRTNVLYLGSQIPFSMARSAVAVLAKANVPLALIKRRSSFKSGNDLQMELGAQRETQRFPALTQQQINAVLNARSEAEFARASM